MTEKDTYKFNGHITLKKMKPKLPKSKDQATFDTKLKISNHSRNRLQTMASIGYSENQRTALDIALQTWYES